MQDNVQTHEKKGCLVARGILFSPISARGHMEGRNLLAGAMTDVPGPAMTDA
jgi:hypothetical protein